MTTVAFIVTVENDEIAVYDQENNRVGTIYNALDYRAFFLFQAGLRKTGFQVYHSSTMDFPEEFTSNPTILRIVREIKEVQL